MVGKYARHSETFLDLVSTVVIRTELHFGSRICSLERKWFTWKNGNDANEREENQLRFLRKLPNGTAVNELPGSCRKTRVNCNFADLLPRRRL